MDTKNTDALIQMCDLDLAVSVVINRADELTHDQMNSIGHAIWVVNIERSKKQKEELGIEQEN